MSPSGKLADKKYTNICHSQPAGRIYLSLSFYEPVIGPECGKRRNSGVEKKYCACIAKGDALSFFLPLHQLEPVRIRPALLPGLRDLRFQNWLS